MKKLLAFFSTVFWAQIASADRFNMYDQESSGGSTPLDVILGLILCVIALIFIGYSALQWKERKESGSKPKPKDDFLDWALTLGSYAVIAAFSCLSILLFLKVLFGADAVRANWYWAFFACFGAIIFFRRT